MRVLIIRLSSMGDIVQTLPALTDAAQHFPDITFDWIVEESFAEIPRWHPNVKNIIPVALRRWRKQPWHSYKQGEWKTALNQLRHTQYDYVIDAQGLIKSALITRLCKGIRCGYDRKSAREILASLAYQKVCHVPKNLPSSLRMRHLFAQALNYALPDSKINYAIPIFSASIEKTEKKYLVFLHGTTWENKHWPEAYWHQLAQVANAHGIAVKLPWGNIAERERAERIAASATQTTLLPKMSLTQLLPVLMNAHGIVSTDTGLGHLSAAIDKPMIFLYGPTTPELTGIYGDKQLNLRAEFPCAPCLRRQCIYKEPLEIHPPCFTTLPPELVWQKLMTLVNSCKN